MRALLLILTLTVACSSKQVAQPMPAPQLPQSVDEAVGSSYRTSDNLVRDKYRHPVETLKFFGIQPNMTVVEIWPSSGWYTEILAPYLASKGEYIGAVNGGTNEENVSSNKKLEGWLKSHPEIAVKARLVKFTPGSTKEIVPPGTADLILTFRNVHNWTKNHAAEAAFEAYFKALKPGGVLGVVEHRAGKHTKPDSGYMKEKFVISLAKKAGFELAEKSEINANPADTKDYPNGVWTLPPSNRHDKADDAKYAAIGESDRMTLKFVKPETK
jgi:predicted methyltransferase